MVWLIIIGVLALAIGPISYMLPSAQDRYLAALRQHARQLVLLYSCVAWTS